MANELFISSESKGERIALLQDKKLVEFHEENKANNFTVGDVFLGTVKKIAPGLNAAFIEVGYEKDAFLHYLDLGPQIKSLLKYVKMAQTGEVNSKLSGFKPEPDIDKLGKIPQVFAKNQQVLVQVVKEPISTKGPRLSCEISIAGRYIVLVPFSNSVSISKKISEKEERQRLVRLMNSIKPEGFGIIVRTVAQGKDVKELDTDLRDLLKKWDDGCKALKTARTADKIIGEMGRANSILRDMLNDNFDTITVDSKETYEDIKVYLKRIAPDKEKILKLYTGKDKLFEINGIEKQIRSSFGRTVSMPNGGYLIIEHTEALHVIDVNSGNKSNSENSQEETALKVNQEACKEVARQLKLRDLGGIIVIDFIDVKDPDNKNLVYATMKEEMLGDRAKYTILPLTKFGLMQITRQRVRPIVNVNTMETCPTCNGTGNIAASINIIDQVEHTLEYLLEKQKEKSVSLVVHPFVYSYYTKGFPSPRMKWFFKYKKWIKLVKDTTLGVVEYKFLDVNSEEIDLHK
ncbi:MAG: Rne/Rng family ribonuclease [Cytophagales bacterium]